MITRSKQYTYYKLLIEWKLGDPFLPLGNIPGEFWVEMQVYGLRKFDQVYPGSKELLCMK